MKTIDEIRAEFTGDAATWHDYVLDQVESVVEHGMAECYEGDTFNWLCDLFGGEMPQKPGVIEQVDTAIRESPRFEPLRVAFEGRFGVDFWGDDEEVY